MPKQQRELSLIVLIEYTTFTQLCHRKKGKPLANHLDDLRTVVNVYGYIGSSKNGHNLWDEPQKICHPVTVMDAFFVPAHWRFQSLVLEQTNPHQQLLPLHRLLTPV